MARGQAAESHTLRKLTVAIALAALGAAPLMNAGAAPSAPLTHPLLVATTPSLLPLGVSCTPTGFCLLLDRQQGATGAREFSTTWNGTKVSGPQRIPNAEFVGDDDDGGLGQLSCASSSFCMAVGQGPELVTSYRWTAGVWKSVPIPSPQPVVPAVPLAKIATQAIGWTSVSCVSSSFCFAVGRNLTNELAGSATTEHVATTFIRWNGSTWSPVAVMQGADIEHVSCVSTTSCIAVGTSSAVWNGSRWTVKGVPGETTDPQTTPAFTSISCVAGATCVAVGSAYSSTSGSETSVIEWTNGAWHLEAIPPTGGVLTQIDCRSATLCLALGYIPEANSTATVLSEWNGTSWISSKVSGQVLFGGVGFTSATSDIVVDVNSSDTATYWLKGQ